MISFHTPYFLFFFRSFPLIRISISFSSHALFLFILSFFRSPCYQSFSFLSFLLNFCWIFAYENILYPLLQALITSTNICGFVSCLWNSKKKYRMRKRKTDEDKCNSLLSFCFKISRWCDFYSSIFNWYKWKW